MKVSFTPKREKTIWMLQNRIRFSKHQKPTFYRWQHSHSGTQFHTVYCSGFRTWTSFTALASSATGCPPMTSSKSTSGSSPRRATASGPDRSRRVSVFRTETRIERGSTFSGRICRTTLRSSSSFPAATGRWCPATSRPTSWSRCTKPTSSPSSSTMPELPEVKLNAQAC